MFYVTIRKYKHPDDIERCESYLAAHCVESLIAYSKIAPVVVSEQFHELHDAVAFINQLPKEWVFYSLVDENDVVLVPSIQYQKDIQFLGPVVALMKAQFESTSLLSTIEKN